MTTNRSRWYLLAFICAIVAGVHVADANYGWATFAGLLGLISGMQAAGGRR